MARLNETEFGFQKAVIRLAEIYGWRVYHVADVRGQLRSPTSRGFPDLVLVRDRILYRELKTDKGKLTERQKRWLEMIVHAGGDARVWRPADWSLIVQTLGKQEHGKIQIV